MIDKFDQRIRQIWHEIERNEPDISTERLIAMTVDRMSMEIGIGFDYTDIIEALERLHKLDGGIK